MKTKPVWLKAAVLGSIWASAEIILGSFLHNLHVPMTGTIMASFGMFLLVSFTQVWKDRGLIWRAGLICALMKSISPSAIIFGPMIGILTEALLLNAFLYMSRGRLAGAIVGSILAVSSTIFIKSIRLWISYGDQLLDILGGIRKFAQKQLGFMEVHEQFLIGALIIVYAIAGIIPALLGYFAGKSVKTSWKSDFSFSIQNSALPWKEGEKSILSVLLLFAHLLLMVGCLLLVNYDLLYLSLAIIPAYLVFCVLRYRQLIRRLMKPSFWLGFVIITFLASVFLVGVSTGDYLSMEGIQTGMKMNIRALLIIFAFTAIGTEIRNPLIQQILFKKGFRNLYNALSLAFSSLPVFIANMPPAKQMIRKPGLAFSNIFDQADSMLNYFQQYKSKHSVIILSGKVQGGKTTMLKELIEKIRKENIPVYGILSDPIHDKKERTGFTLVDIENNRRYPLCSIHEEEGTQAVGKYFFQQETVSKGNQILKKCSTHESGILIIDELGHMEMHNKGWHDGVLELKESKLIQLWIVRDFLIDEIREKYNPTSSITFYADENSVDEIYSSISSAYHSSIELQSADQKQ